MERFFALWNGEPGWIFRFCSGEKSRHFRNPHRGPHLPQYENQWKLIQQLEVLLKDNHNIISHNQDPPFICMVIFMRCDHKVME